MAKKRKKKSWRDNVVQKTIKDESKYSLLFDEDKITIISDLHTSEINWSYYFYYSESSDSIFIISKSNLYNYLCFSSSEIGEDHLDSLKTVARKNLIPLPV